MKTELLYLVWVTVLTGLIWVPYILARPAVWGLADTVGYPENPKPQSPWAAYDEGAPECHREPGDLRCTRAGGAGHERDQQCDRDRVHRVLLGARRAPRGVHVRPPLGPHPRVHG